MNTFFSGPDRPREDGHQHSVCVCQEGLQVRLHRGVSLLPGELLPAHQLHLGQHDGQRRPGESTPQLPVNPPLDVLYITCSGGGLL